MRLKPLPTVLFNVSKLLQLRITGLKPVTTKLSAFMLAGLGSAVMTSLSISAYAAEPVNVLDGYNNVHNTSANPAHTLSAESEQLAKRLIASAEKQNLAAHPSWLRLHYYKESGRLANAATYVSDVNNPDFFLSKHGVSDPQAELETFIKALVYMDQVSDNGIVNDIVNDGVIAPENNPICRFPARTHWLKEKLNLPADRFTADCPEFDAWFNEIDPQRLSVFLAQEYPDRTVSAFGHLLLLIESTASLANPANIDQSYALNDDVAGDPDDSMPVFAVKASTGGYSNKITIDPYPQKLAEYIQEDNRDVWTYPLDLTTPEVQQIIRHVWESKDLELPYYFTMDNCASEVLRYIDIVRPKGNLLDEFKVAVIPSEVVRLLHDEGLLVDQTFLPSDETLEQAKLNQSILDSSKNSRFPDSIISADNTLIPTDQLVPNNDNPIARHLLKRVTTGVGVEGDTGYFDVGLRFGFHDRLDNPAGFPQNYNMTVLSGNLRVYEDKDKHGSKQTPNNSRIELDQFTILQGRSFNPMNTAKKRDSMLASWGVKAAVTQVKDASKIDESNHLVGDVAYEKGMTVAFGNPPAGSGELPPHLCYALGSGNAQVGKSLSHGYRVGAGINVGCQYQVGQMGSENNERNRVRLIGELSMPYWYHGNVDSNQVTDHYWQPILSLGAQYDIDRTQGIRLQGTYELQERVANRKDIKLAYVRYF